MEQNAFPSLPTPHSLEFLTLAQAIITAHQKSFNNQEELLKEIRDQPKAFLNAQYYESRHQDLERRVALVEGALSQMQTAIAALPEKIMEKIESRSTVSRTQILTISVAIVNGILAIGLALFHH